MNESRETGNGMSATQATGWLRDHSSRIMTAGVILALLYLARTPATDSPDILFRSSRSTSLSGWPSG
jgi:hypothetical protein